MRSRARAFYRVLLYDCSERASTNQSRERPRIESRFPSCRISNVPSGHAAFWRNQTPAGNTKTHQIVLMLLSLDTTRFITFHWFTAGTIRVKYHPPLPSPFLPPVWRKCSDAILVVVGEWLRNPPSSPNSPIRFEEIPDSYPSLNCPVLSHVVSASMSRRAVASCAMSCEEVTSWSPTTILSYKEQNAAYPCCTNPNYNTHM